MEWEWLRQNPAKRVPNPPRRSKERPFESWDQIVAVAEQLRPVYGAMVIFAAATGLRPWVEDSRAVVAGDTLVDFGKASRSPTGSERA